MERKGKAAAAAALALLLLTGCGAKPGDDGNQAGAAPTVQGDRGGPGNGRQPVDLIGKVKSVSGQTITVYKSDFVPGRGGPAGGRNGGWPRPTGENGQASPGGSSGANGSGQGNGRGQGRFNMQDRFTDQTEDVQVTADTKIVKREFADNQMTEKEIPIGDLKAGDILGIDLKDGTQEAVTITLGGGFGGRRQGGGTNQNQGQN